MNQRLTLMMLAAAVTAGCGKKNDDDKAASAAPATATTTAEKPKPTPPPEEPGFEQSTVVFCAEGKHVKENVTISAGSPYAMLIKGPCQVTLKNCTLIATADAEQPAVQVMENGVLRLEGCTVKAENPKMPALWVSTGGKVTLVKTRLESIMKNSIDVWENSSVEHFDISYTGEPNVRKTGTLTKLDATPPPL